MRRSHGLQCSDRGVFGKQVCAMRREHGLHGVPEDDLLGEPMRGMRCELRLQGRREAHLFGQQVRGVRWEHGLHGVPEDHVLGEPMRGMHVEYAVPHHETRLLERALYHLLRG